MERVIDREIVDAEIGLGDRAHDLEVLDARAVRQRACRRKRRIEQVSVI